MLSAFLPTQSFCKEWRKIYLQVLFLTLRLMLELSYRKLSECGQLRRMLGGAESGDLSPVLFLGFERLEWRR